MKCQGSGRRGLDGRFPGDSDRCTVCSRDHVRVKEDGTLSSHAQGKETR